MLCWEFVYLGLVIWVLVIGWVVEIVIFCGWLLVYFVCWIFNGIDLVFLSYYVFELVVVGRLVVS